MVVKPNDAIDFLLFEFEYSIVEKDTYYHLICMAYKYLTIKEYIGGIHRCTIGQLAKCRTQFLQMCRHDVIRIDVAAQNRLCCMGGVNGHLQEGA